MLLRLSSIIILVIASLCDAQKVTFEWNYLNFSWPSSQAYENAMKDGIYIPENTVITGIKVYKDNVYLTLPRWKHGIPATLTKVSRTAAKESPILHPFPNWNFQKLDDCSAFQYVQSMEIDPRGRMWILDNGRTEFKSEQPRTKCRPRLVVLDLESRNNDILLDYKFSESVVNKQSVFLNDLVLDHEDGGYVYITDHDIKDPGIIVFSLRDRDAWKVRHDRSMRPAKEAEQMKFEDNFMKIEGPVDGIALSPASTEDHRTLYYTPLSSYEIFSIPTNILKNRKLSTDHVDRYVKLVSRKSSQSDGMIVNADGILYFGLLTEYSVNYYDTKSNKNLTQCVLYRDRTTNQWPDTFAIDDNGWLWWTPNALQNYFTGKQNRRDINYRVVTLETESKSYQYYKDGSYPRLPVIH